MCTHTHRERGGRRRRRELCARSIDSNCVQWRRRQSHKLQLCRLFLSLSSSLNPAMWCNSFPLFSLFLVDPSLSFYSLFTGRNGRMRTVSSASTPRLFCSFVLQWRNEIHLNLVPVFFFFFFFFSYRKGEKEREARRKSSSGEQLILLPYSLSAISFPNLKVIGQFTLRLDKSVPS